MKQNKPCYLFGMYEPDTNSVIINAINDTYSGTPLIISCENVIQLSCLIHLMILHIYIGWHRKALCCMLNWLANLMDYRNMWML